MKFSDIFNFSLFRSPEARQSAELSGFEKKMTKISSTVEMWLEEAALKLDRLLTDDDDGKPQPMPVFRREFNLKSFAPAQITHKLLGELSGLEDLRETAAQLESQFVLEVKADKPHAQIVITIDPGKPHRESKVVLAPHKSPLPR